MFRTSFRTSQIRCQVQKFIMKFTNRFVNWAFDWLVWFNSQSETLFTNLFVNFIMNFWTWQRICEVRNEVRNLTVKSPLKLTVRLITNFEYLKYLKDKFKFCVLRANFFQCHVFAMKSVQNLKSFWRSSQNYFVLALFS
jgi:hypothetical protein